MALVANRTEVGLERIGGSVTCPDDPRARLMFYLKCMCDVLDLDNPNIYRLIDYQNYFRLTPKEITDLMTLCVLLSPDELEGKCIFEDANVCGEKMNQFVAVEAVQHRLLVTPELMLGNQVKHVKKIMFYKKAFLEFYYLIPIVQLKLAIDVMTLEALAHTRTIQQQQLQRQQRPAITYQRQEHRTMVTPPRRASPTPAYSSYRERYIRLQILKQL